MDFGAMSVLDGQGSPVPAAALGCFLAWFERGSADAGALGERRAELLGGLLDRFREADGLAEQGEGEYDV